MASIPEIVVIQATDAPQHTDRLRDILQELETENRISGFTFRSPDDDLSSVSDTLKKNDMILILLTSELEGKREQIKKRVSALKSDQPGLRVAEILVDNIVFDNDYITFPGDLRPIRNREDMDVAWNSIEASMKDMFPVGKTQEAKPFPAWMVIVAIGILLLGGLAWYLLTTDTSEPYVEVVVRGAEVAAEMAGLYSEAFDCERDEGGAWFGGVDYSYCFRKENGSGWLIWNTGCGWEIGRQVAYRGWERYARTYTGQCSAIPPEQLDTRALTTQTYYNPFGNPIAGVESIYNSPR